MNREARTAVAVVVVVVLKCTLTDDGSFLLIHSIKTVLLISVYFLLFCSFCEISVVLRQFGWD